uniref:Peptidase M12B propeptide domain-containing protein n=1 Tax=Meloidogyne incognita TaxID=6306 RepID=A0A914LBW7_MELIC
MSISELQQTFGVSKHEHVPDYHLLDFFKRIENKNNNSRHLHFKAFNSSYLIQLIPNKLISPHMISVFDSKQQYGFPSHVKTNCHFHGIVLSHGNIKAAISDCNRLMGIIIHEENFLVLQTLPERVKRKNEKEARKNNFL